MNDKKHRSNYRTSSHDFNDNACRSDPEIHDNNVNGTVKTMVKTMGDVEIIDISSSDDEGERQECTAQGIEFIDDSSDDDDNEQDQKCPAQCNWQSTANARAHFSERNTMNIETTASDNTTVPLTYQWMVQHVDVKVATEEDILQGVLLCSPYIDEDDDWCVNVGFWIAVEGGEDEWTVVVASCSSCSRPGASVHLYAEFSEDESLPSQLVDDDVSDVERHGNHITRTKNASPRCATKRPRVCHVDEDCKMPARQKQHGLTMTPRHSSIYSLILANGQGDVIGSLPGDYWISFEPAPPLPECLTYYLATLAPGERRLCQNATKAICSVLRYARTKHVPPDLLLEMIEKERSNEFGLQGIAAALNKYFDSPTDRPVAYDSSARHCEIVQHVNNPTDFVQPFFRCWIIGNGKRFSELPDNENLH
jgi:hypothetical protein